MGTVVVETFIARPPEEVFAYLRDTLMRRSGNPSMSHNQLWTRLDQPE
jgi:hypothetical protein